MPNSGTGVSGNGVAETGTVVFVGEAVTESVGLSVGKAVVGTAVGVTVGSGVSSISGSSVGSAVGTFTFETSREYVFEMLS